MNLTQNPYPLAGKCSSFYKLQAVLGILFFKTVTGSYTQVTKGGLYHSFNGHDSSEESIKFRMAHSFHSPKGKQKVNFSA